jgi:FkbM family methyltransferase
VLAFEPMPLHQDCWRKNMEGIENAGLYEFALGENKGMVKLETRTPGSSGDTQVRPGEVGTIPMETLDSFNFQEVDLIKIDCEGFEEFVLRGAVETLERCKPCVIVEQKRDFSARYGCKKQSAVTLLQDMGAILRQEVSGDFILSWD